MSFGNRLPRWLTACTLALAVAHGWAVPAQPGAPLATPAIRPTSRFNSPRATDCRPAGGAAARGAAPGPAGPRLHPRETRRACCPDVVVPLRDRDRRLAIYGPPGLTALWTGLKPVVGRVDYRVSDNQSVFGRFNIQDDTVNSAPILSDSLLFFTTSDQFVHAVKSATGIPRWQNRLPFRFGNSTKTHGRQVVVRAMPMVPITAPMCCHKQPAVWICLMLENSVRPCA